MKKISVFVFLFVFGLSSSIFAQKQTGPEEKRVTLSLKNQSVVEVFKAIQVSTGLNFIYNDKDFSDVKELNVEAKNEKVKDLLKRLFSQKQITFEFTDNTVVVRSANIVSITGIVRDKNTKEVLPGANVLIVGTSKGTQTNIDGTFTLSFARMKNNKIAISFLGYATKEVDVNKDGYYAIELLEDAQSLSDIVITGIFKKSRESYTGAISTITADEIISYRGQNLLQTLKNIDPAFNIAENNLLGSNPNRLPDITIRGNSSMSTSVEEFNAGNKNNLNTPLIIMDGFEISLTKLMDYNDEEIESINILKDAAATAIYGSRGANGVVVIVSKQPQAGKLKVYAQIGSIAEIPDLSSYNLMNATEKLKLEWEAGLYNAENPERDILFKEAYYKRLKSTLEGVDTYWLNHPLHTGIGQNYNLRFEGGGKEFRWSASLGYKDIQGAMIGSERKTFNGGITLSYTYENFIFRNYTSIGRNKSKESPYGSFSSYVEQQPYNTPYDAEGKIIRYFDDWDAWSGQIQNPLYDATLVNKEESRYTEIINNSSVEWKILPELTLRGQFGILHNDNTYDKYLSPKSSAFINYEGDRVLRRGSYAFTTGKDNTFEGNLTLSYSKILKKKHSLYTGIDGSAAQSDGYSYYFNVEGFPNDKPFIGNALHYPQNGTPSAVESKIRRVGLVGNLNYVYDNRYYTDFSLRTDGSSQFGAKNRFATFWSTGVGWNIHRETFFKENEFINNLRLRLSYGQTGSQKFQPWQALSTFEYYTDKKYGIRSGAYLKGLGNENLKWQITSQYNTGLEFAILNNRIKGNFDYYSKETNNLLSSMSLPYSTGFSSYMENIGVVRNTGYEISLNGYLIRDEQKDIVLILSTKLAYNKNKIIRLSDDIKRQTAEYLKQDKDIAYLFYEGRSQNALYAVRSLGIDPSSGTEIFLDKEGNSTYEWNPSDKVYLGVNEPLYNGNAGLMFSWKDLTINLSFGYHWGGKQYNATLLDKVELTANAIRSRNVDRRVLSDRWLHEGDIAFFKGISDTETRATSRFVMSDNVFEMQAASLQYKWKALYFRKIGVQIVTLGVNASDLFYISSVKRERGTAYPFTRTVGANISLLF
ncbi:SusC/RagA family TonB-linked outer membrane protein [Limibacterium fermenti]|uniref:SusC/RagA family TonB-linked outer membrane protein n=1 Tax=Limibacterium fermenti TaxID=3229863 RepID=UPI003A7871D3